MITLSKVTLSKITLSKITLIIITLIIEMKGTRHSITTQDAHSIFLMSFIMLSAVYNHYNVLIDVLSIIMLSVTMLSVIMLSVVMQSVVMISVVYT